LGPTTDTSYTLTISKQSDGSQVAVISNIDPSAGYVTYIPVGFYNPPPILIATLVGDQTSNNIPVNPTVFKLVNAASQTCCPSS